MVPVNLFRVDGAPAGCGPRANRRPPIPHTPPPNKPITPPLFRPQRLLREANLSRPVHRRLPHDRQPLPDRRLLIQTSPTNIFVAAPLPGFGDDFTTFGATLSLTRPWLAGATRRSGKSRSKTAKDNRSVQNPTSPGNTGLRFRVDGVGCPGPGSLWDKDGANCSE